MTNKEKAIAITQRFIQNHEIYHTFAVDIANIIEQETLWYVPFKEINPEPNVFWGGAYNGLLIDKFSEEYMQPGSGYALEKWMYGFRIGLRGGRYDLLIEKVNRYQETLEILNQLDLTFVKIELEGGIEWKIPRSFHRKQIKRRIDHLPCVFKNQGLSSAIDEFKKINNQHLFEYQLLKTQNTNPKILGELIEG